MIITHDQPLRALLMLPRKRLDDAPATRTHHNRLALRPLRPQCCRSKGGATTADFTRSDSTVAPHARVYVCLHAPSRCPPKQAPASLHPCPRAWSGLTLHPPMEVSNTEVDVHRSFKQQIAPEVFRGNPRVGSQARRGGKAQRKGPTNRPTDSRHIYWVSVVWWGSRPHLKAQAGETA
jgi:hypothetical protein